MSSISEINTYCQRNHIIPFYKTTPSPAGVLCSLVIGDRFSDTVLSSSQKGAKNLAATSFLQKYDIPTHSKEDHSMYFCYKELSAAFELFTIKKLKGIMLDIQKIDDEGNFFTVIIDKGGVPESAFPTSLNGVDHFADTKHYYVDDAFWYACRDASKSLTFPVVRQLLTLWGVDIYEAELPSGTTAYHVTPTRHTITPSSVGELIESSYQFMKKLWYYDTNNILARLQMVYLYTKDNDEFLQTGDIKIVHECDTEHLNEHIIPFSNGDQIKFYSDYSNVYFANDKFADIRKNKAHYIINHKRYEYYGAFRKFHVNVFSDELYYVES